jgi:hypothetical protein
VYIFENSDVIEFIEPFHDNSFVLYFIISLVIFLREFISNKEPLITIEKNWNINFDQENKPSSKCSMEIS